MVTMSLEAVLCPLAVIADAHDAGELDHERGATTPAERVELYQGRGGRELLTLAQAFAARSALSTGTGLDAALQPLVAIAEAFAANDLDDEARRFRGRDHEHENTTPAEEIELVHTRGGACLLTLADALAARRVGTTARAA